MAFNPFSTFQKNQKFWMAAILMICMVTFVFCTGSRGDVYDAIMRQFRGTGPTVVRVAGYNLSQFDLTTLRDERNIVNDFMRAGCDIAVRAIDEQMQKVKDQPDPTDKKKLEERQQFLTQRLREKMVLLDRLRRPRYFEGGVKLDDLIEFKLWEGLANRLNIRLLPDDVDLMVRLEFFSPRYDLVSPQQLQEAQFIAQRHRDIGAGVMAPAITREFRVRLARLAYEEMRPGYLQGPVPIPGIPTEQRVPVTLAELWKVYQEKRAEFDVTLIPIHVADFTKEIAKLKGPPPESELEKLFEKYKRNKYDPESPLPSFETPAEVQAEFIMADPTSPIYVAATRATTLLEQMMPVGGCPLQSPLIAAARVGAFSAARLADAETILEGLSLKKYDLYGGPDLVANDFYWPLAAHLAERDPRAIASYMGHVAASVGMPVLPGASAWAGLLAVPMTSDAARLEAGYADESKRRLLPSAKVAAAFATGQPLDVVGAALLEFKLERPQFMFAMRQGRTLLPLPIIAPELEQTMDSRIAERWASRNLMTVKRMLDRSMKPEAVKRVVEDAVPKYNLLHVITKNFYSKYNIDKAPSLAPLREAYDRYYREINWFEKRDLTPERQLKESDFDKLFFGSEPFTSTTKYQVRSWPPDIHPNQMQLMNMPGPHQIEEPDVSPDVLADVQKFMHRGKNTGEAFRLLDKAQKPALYWRHDDRLAEFPKTLAAAKDRVIAAWETELAREDKALPLAKKIAEELKRAEGEFPPSLCARAAHEAGHPEIVLDKIAPLVPKKVGNMIMGGQRDYFAYQLPKDKIDLPRDDMVKDLLRLYDLKAPIDAKTGLTGGEPSFVKELNDINKSLFDAVKREKDPKGKFVQILTNKPQTVYYVAVVSRPPVADPKDFQDYVLKFASETQMRPVDTFATRAQELLARDFHPLLIAQLKNDLGFEPISDLDETRKTFDRDEHGG